MCKRSRCSKEKHYNKYKGDGPRKDDGQVPDLAEEPAADRRRYGREFRRPSSIGFSGRLEAREPRTRPSSYGWEKLTMIRVREDAVYIGLTNPYIEDRMVQHQLPFRGDDKTELAPYPGVDHVAALPTDVLIIKEGDKTVVLHYGQMWRMQLYFWDSGYRAFTANDRTRAQQDRAIRSKTCSEPAESKRIISDRLFAGSSVR